MYAGDPGHRRDSKTRLPPCLSPAPLFCLFDHLSVSLPVCLSAGAVHGDERPVHEERSGLRSRLLHHGSVDLQRPSGPPGADPPSEGHRGRTTTRAHTHTKDTPVSTECNLTSCDITQIQVEHLVCELGSPSRCRFP